MEIIVGKYSGFCNGVRYTVEEANRVLDEKESIYSIGQIVHNERVISELENKGMIIVNSIDEVPNNSRVIIRAHGETKETYDKAKIKRIDIIDLTCGKIKAIRIKISKKVKDHFIIIIGKKSHPETLGVQSFSGKDSFIIENEDDIKECIDKIMNTTKDKIYIVSQTTFNSDKFDRLVNNIKDNTDREVFVDKTICDATSNRQDETNKLSKNVDVMIVVGGKNSSNTKELEVISKNNCQNVFLIQDINDLRKIKISTNNKVGIMAGASTPQIVVDEIINYLDSL